MRIGVMSDSHGNTMAVDRAIELAGSVDCWLHAGDLIEDAEYLAMVTDKKVINVAGNCDCQALERMMRSWQRLAPIRFF